MKPGYIDVTDVPLETLVRAAYGPSRQHGLGCFDRAGWRDLSEEQVAEIIDRNKPKELSDGSIYTPHVAVCMDYVNGRSIKFSVKRIGGRHVIHNRWYDHSDDELRDLLERVGIGRDVVDKARAAEDAHMAECKSLALTWLQDRGGEVKQDRGLRRVDPVETIPDDVDSGLTLLLAENAVTEKYVEGYSVWSIKK